MNTSNPYESPSTETESGSWRKTDFFVAGLWIAIPIGVFVGRQQLIPVLQDFDVELPIATQYLLSVYSPILLAITALVVLLAMFVIPYGRTRHRIVWVACISGLLTAVVCLMSIVGPLWSLWRNLG